MLRTIKQFFGKKVLVTSAPFSLEQIKNLQPCQSRLDNFIRHYPEWSGSIDEFLSLDKITHEDKLWVAFRMMPADCVKLAAADMAESVLHIFESHYPNDKRPREAIEAARTGSPEQARAAAAAAYSAYSAAASFAATSASSSFAATSASSSAAAAASAYYAAASSAYYAAARSAALSASAASSASAYYAAASSAEKQKQLEIIKRYWKE